MSVKIRLLWKKTLDDSDGKCVENRYGSDIIELPDNAVAFTLTGQIHRDKYLPELIGCEWLKENAE